MTFSNNPKERPLSLEERATSLSQSTWVYIATVFMLLIGIPLLIVGIVFVSSSKHYDVGIGLAVVGLVLVLLSSVFIIVIVSGRSAGTDSIEETTPVERSRGAHSTPIGSILEAMGPPPPPYGNSSGPVSSTLEAMTPDSSGSRSFRGESQPVNYIQRIPGDSQTRISTIPIAMPEGNELSLSTVGVPYISSLAFPPPVGVNQTIRKAERTPPLATSSVQSYSHSSNPNVSIDSSLSGRASLS